MYCEKCGKTYWVYFFKRCNFCGTKLKVLSEELKYKYHIFVEDWEDISYEDIILRKEAFVMEVLKNNPLFSMEEYEDRVRRERKRNKELDEYHHQQMLERQSKNIARMQKEADKRNCVPRCPVCGSSNIGKITVAKRAAKTAVFGAIGAMDDMGKTWKCNNCGSKF